MKLGLVAGGGALPALLEKVASVKGVELVIVALDGMADASFQTENVTFLALTELESILSHFKSEEVSDIILAGKVTRPDITEGANIDATTAALLAKTLPLGDDAALRAVLQFLQTSGLKVIPLQTVLSDHVLAADFDSEAGTELPHEMVAMALKAHEQLSPLDCGQALLLQGQRLLAIEAAEGTDEMVARTASLSVTGAGPVMFFKASKTTQNKLLDPPVFGMTTLQHCMAAGVSLIALEAKHCIIAAPLDEVLAFCKTHKMRLISVTCEAG